MSYNNGLLEYGSSGQGKQGKQGLPGIGFKHTPEGNFNIDDKRLVNVAKPEEDADAVIKKYADDELYKKADTTSHDNLKAELANKEDLQTLNVQTFQSKIRIPDFDSASQDNQEVVILTHIRQTYLNKKAGGIVENVIRFAGDADNKRQVLRLGTPLRDDAVTSKAYVDAELAEKHDAFDQSDSLNRKTGGTMEGAITFDSTKSHYDRQVNGLGDPATNNSATRKVYVDDQLKKKADLSVMLNELSGKASQANMDIRLADKADLSYVKTELAKKSELSYVNTELAKKSR